LAAAILLRTVAQGVPVYWRTFVGELGPLVVKLPGVHVLWAVMLVAAIALDGPPARIARGGGWLGAAFALDDDVHDGVLAGTRSASDHPRRRPLLGACVPLLVFALPSWSRALPEPVRFAVLGVAASSLWLPSSGSPRSTMLRRALFNRRSAPGGGRRLRVLRGMHLAPRGTPSWSVQMTIRLCRPATARHARSRTRCITRFAAKA
jgi:hypothetical protein